MHATINDRLTSTVDRSIAKGGVLRDFTTLKSLATPRNYLAALTCSRLGKHHGYNVQLLLVNKMWL